MNALNEALAAAYKNLWQELSTVLYDEDPAGMGATIGAPLDEYDGVAARAAVALRTAASTEEVKSYLTNTFGDCSPSLLKRIDSALARFRAATATSLRTQSSE